MVLITQWTCAYFLTVFHKVEATFIFAFSNCYLIDEHLFIKLWLFGIWFYLIIELQVFQKEEIEPLQVKQQDANWLGQGLIQSAANGTSTQTLEHDLDQVNSQWKTLNKKVTLLSLLCYYNYYYSSDH